MELYELVYCRVNDLVQRERDWAPRAGNLSAGFRSVHNKGCKSHGTGARIWSGGR